MTCIIGWIDKNKTVYIGGDSAGVNGLNIISRKDPKVFRNKNMIMGYTSSFRMGQLLRFKLKIPVHPVGMDDYQYMCTKFIDNVRKCLKDNGYAVIKDNKETVGTFLVGYRGGLYSVDDDLQVGMTNEKYNSCGCGYQYAKGVLETHNKKTENPEQVILEALRVAEKFNGGVRRPFVILALGKRSRNR